MFRIYIEEFLMSEENRKSFNLV